MLKNFKKHIENNLTFLENGKLLIAISGGIDSVVLTHFCYNLKFNIALAHCNFNLRGAESNADEAFVANLAKDLNIEVFTKQFNTHAYAKNNKLSIQMAAREIRYSWFLELTKQLHFDNVLTAHHADDNLETLLINLTRGTGLDGLLGIPAINGKFARPLLPFSRQDIEAFAISNNIKWREDSSNMSVKYLRNKLRHEVIPILKEINPDLLQSFQTTVNNLNDTADIVEESVNAVLKRAITTIDEHHIAFKISEFKKVNNSKAYLFEVFKNFGFTDWSDMVNLLDAKTGKKLLSNTHRLIKNRDNLLLSTIVSKTQETITISKDDKEKRTPFGRLVFTEVEAITEYSKNIIYVDMETLNFPLILRNKIEGDVFYPLGMKGKKRVSKYFKDEKLSLIDKENIWLLCSDNHIVWIISRRADERFKVTKKTNGILKIEFKRDS